MKVAVSNSRTVIENPSIRLECVSEPATAPPAVGTAHELIPFQLSRSKWESLSSTKRAALRSLAYSIRLVQLRISTKAADSTALLPAIEWDTMKRSLLNQSTSGGRVRQENVYKIGMDKHICH
eukprot:767298-Hanusia_phi.AAC.2